MKNLFISMGDAINVRNFATGSLSYCEFNASDVADLVKKTRSGGGKIVAYFEVGSVPSKKKQRDFHDLGSGLLTNKLRALRVRLQRGRPSGTGHIALRPGANL